jgi:hypothetical protein
MSSRKGETCFKEFSMKYIEGFRTGKKSIMCRYIEYLNEEVLRDKKYIGQNEIPLIAFAYRRPVLIASDAGVQFTLNIPIFNSDGPNEMLAITPGMAEVGLRIRDGTNTPLDDGTLAVLRLAANTVNFQTDVLDVVDDMLRNNGVLMDINTLRAAGIDIEVVEGILNDFIENLVIHCYEQGGCIGLMNVHGNHWQALSLNH